MEAETSWLDVPQEIRFYVYILAGRRHIKLHRAIYANQCLADRCNRMLNMNIYWNNSGSVVRKWERCAGRLEVLEIQSKKWWGDNYVYNYLKS